MARHGQPEIVFKIRLKLRPEQKALGEHAAALLDHVAEVRFETVVCDDKGLAEQQAVFRAADVEDIAVVRKIRRGQIVSLRNQRGGQACTV